MNMMVSLLGQLDLQDDQRISKEQKLAKEPLFCEFRCKKYVIPFEADETERQQRFTAFNHLVLF